MSKVAVVFHSGYGHTVKQAAAVAQGANAELVAIDAEGNITEAQWLTLNEADAIVFGSPTYMDQSAGSLRSLPMRLPSLGLASSGKTKYLAVH